MAPRVTRAIRAPSAQRAASCPKPRAAARCVPRGPHAADRRSNSLVLVRRADRVSRAARPCLRSLLSVASIERCRPMFPLLLCFVLLPVARRCGYRYRSRRAFRLLLSSFAAIAIAPDRFGCQGWSRAPSLRSVPRSPVSDRRGAGVAGAVVLATAACYVDERVAAFLKIEGAASGYSRTGYPLAGWPMRWAAPRAGWPRSGLPARQLRG